MTEALLEPWLENIATAIQDALEHDSWQPSVAESIPMDTRRALVELALRRLLHKSISKDDRRVFRLLEVADTIGIEMADAGIALVLLEEWAETLPVWRLAAVLDFLEPRAASLVESASMAKGKGLVLLRLCNEMLRRLDKTHDAPLCGRILLLLSKAFPSGERSGVNLRGDLNIDNGTRIEEEDPADAAALREAAAKTVDLPARVFEYDFYRCFWRLQFFIYHPVQALMSDSWPAIRRLLEELLAILERTKSISNEHRHINMAEYYPKFLSSRPLLHLQLVDPYFRQTILVQILIFLQHLLAFSSKEEHKPPNAKTLSTSLLTTDQEGWISDFNRRVFLLISSMEDGRSLFRQLRWILKCERNWMIWKSSSCPSYERPSLEPSLAPPTAKGRRIYYDMKRFSDGTNLGSAELTRLWLHSGQGLQGLSERHLKPVLGEFLAQLAEQLDPEAGIEEEYRLSRDEIFRWKALRLLLSDHTAIEAFGRCRSASDIDNFVRSHFAPPVTAITNTAATMAISSPPPPSTTPSDGSTNQQPSPSQSQGS